MLYDAYQAQQDFLAPLRAGADLIKAALSDTVHGGCACLPPQPNRRRILPMPVAVTSAT